MKRFLISAFLLFATLGVVQADSTKPSGSSSASLESQKSKDQARERIVQKLEKYKKKLNDYLAARGQDELNESTTNEYSQLRTEVQNRIKVLEGRKQKMLERVEKKYDFSDVNSTKKTIEKINRKLKVIKEEALKDLPTKSIN